MGDQTFFEKTTKDYEIKKIEKAFAKDPEFKYYLYEGERKNGKDDSKPKDQRLPQFVFIKHFVFKSAEEKNNSPMYETFQSFYKLHDLSDEPENDVGNYLLRLFKPIENDTELIFFQKNKRYVNLIDGFKKDKFEFIAIVSKLLFIYKKLHESDCLMKVLDEAFDRVRKKNLYATWSKKNKQKVWIDFLNPTPLKTERLEGTPMEHLSIVLMEWLYDTEFESKEEAIEKFNDPHTPFPIDDELVKHFMKNLLNKESLKLLQVLSHPFFSTHITENSNIWQEEKGIIIIDKKKAGPKYESHTSIVRDHIVNLLNEQIKKRENDCLISIISYFYLRMIIFYSKKIIDINEDGDDSLNAALIHYKFEKSKLIIKYENHKKANLQIIKKFIEFKENPYEIGEFNEILTDPLDFSLIQYFKNSKTKIITKLRVALNWKDCNKEEEKIFSMINAEIWT